MIMQVFGWSSPWLPPPGPLSSSVSRSTSSTSLSESLTTILIVVPSLTAVIVIWPTTTPLTEKISVKPPAGRFWISNVPLPETVTEREEFSWTVTTILPAVADPAETLALEALPVAFWRTTPCSFTPLPEGDAGLEPPPQRSIAAAATNTRR
ncbi:MAG: hypothetical protein DMF82_08840 [Acidobacteria bacterium]|nr:MAG: hypothetical protein DMF82_08840 [Acidobacteriota bacterium]